MGNKETYSMRKMGPLGFVKHLISWLSLLGTIKPSTITNTMTLLDTVTDPSVYTYTASGHLINIFNQDVQDKRS